VGGPPVFIAWTSTPRARDGSTDRLYAADLNDRSLTMFIAIDYEVVSQGNQEYLVRRVATHYGITSKFVTKYWSGKFDPNSVVFMSACHSAEPLTLDFGMAVLNAGASAYLGWSDRMLIAQAVVSGAYFFDRLLGTNGSEPPEVPPQRAFSWGAVLSDMATHPRPNGVVPMMDTTSFVENGQAVQAKMIPLALQGTFTQLAPSIESLQVDEQNNELIINGYFGDAKGDVTINGNPMTIKSWTPGEIHCEIARSGADASGDVAVFASAPRQRSNTVQLSEWSGTVTATYFGKGSLKMVWSFNVHLRGDVHERRSEPHETPLMPGANMVNVLDSNGSYARSGLYVDPDGSYRDEWSGSGALSSFTAPPTGSGGSPASGVVVQGGFDSQRNWSMTVNANALDALTVHRITYGLGGVVTSDTTEQENAGWLSLNDMNGGLRLAVASIGYDVPGGTVSHDLSPEEHLTLTWTAMQARHPPIGDDTCPDPADPQQAAAVCVERGR